MTPFHKWDKGLEHERGEKSTNNAKKEMVRNKVSELGDGQKHQPNTENNCATIWIERLTSDQTVVHP
jgi:hypothetical protein